jgi:cAMP-dependent protein kinase regulator
VAQASRRPEELQRIQAAVKGKVVFEGLGQAQRRQLCAAVVGRSVRAGEVVIEQGADGDNYYIIERGAFDVRVAPTA